MQATLKTCEESYHWIRNSVLTLDRKLNPMPHTKINSQWTENINARAESITLLEKSTSKYL
jgi:hypothetical protein